MVFSSVEFLFYFLPLVLCLYVLSPGFARNALLLFFSLLFYVWGSGEIVLVLATVVVANYGFGLLLAAARRSRPPLLPRLTAACVAADLAVLGYFKYTNFFVEQVNGAALPLLGETLLPPASVVLPIGVSFFIFHAISYVIDVARGTVRAQSNPLDFALYITFFPQLVAGPIVRYKQIAGQLRQRSAGLDDLSAGALRFVHGLLKKVLIADPAGEIAHAAFMLPPDQLGTGAAWLGLVAYTVQIYFDFSGYSDMAIGLARMFGFRFPENFDRPYSAHSVTDFWRRWHMSLSGWFRDYVYLPLGGSRGSTARTYANLAGVFLLTGAWHGASWTFIAWGAYHGAWLIVERLAGWREGMSRAWLARAVTLLAVMLGWVLFRSETLAQAAQYYAALAGAGDLPLPPAMAVQLSHLNLAALGIGAAAVLLPPGFVFGRYLESATGRGPEAVRAAVILVALPVALARVANSSFSPFLYFQF